MKTLAPLVSAIFATGFADVGSIKELRTKLTALGLFGMCLSIAPVRDKSFFRPDYISSSVRALKVAVSGMFVLLVFAAPIAAPAQAYKVVGNGVYSYSPLVQGFDGNLYGAAYGIQGTYGKAGSIFRMTNSGKITTIYTFCSQPSCTDGIRPGGLVVGTDGNIYGITFQGGANTNANCNFDGTQLSCGTLFQITQTGKLTTLYSFCSVADCADGSLPVGPLIQATDGNFYGMTSSGGNTQYCTINSNGCGTIFEITSAGKLTTLYAFCGSSGCLDGAYPYGNLTEGLDGNLYGTTASGGAGAWYFNCSGCGTIFKVTPQGVLTSLYNFCISESCTDGSTPEVGLVLAANGVFYGATTGGGANNYGTIYSFTASGGLTTLYSFCSQPNCTDGEESGALIQATDGNLYGYTPFGGTTDSGTLFKITTSGALTTIYQYPYCGVSCGPGAFPQDTLLQDTNGIIYGSADVGSTGNGVIYSWTAPQLHRFVETLPSSGKVGAKVTILGNKLTGATAVSFNGTEATFTVVSGNEIATAVPSGATSGKVKVTTPGGVISTYVEFRVP